VEQFIAGGDVNCDSIIYIEITYTERQGAVTLSPLLTVEQGGTITIDPLITFDPASISWVSNLDLSCFDCMAPMVFGDQSGWLKLVVTDINGCNYEATAQLEIKGIRTEFAFIPNAFSPNGDGINDVFEVFPDYNWATEVRHLKIVDRWGRVVYSSEQNKWDGTTNGSLALPGVYIYAVELIMKDGTVSNQQGSVFLYR
jgi:gliding motility-associated-like protein